MTPRSPGSTPAVSVVIATYNRPELLHRALASLAAQTHRGFEVVVVNDAGVPVEHVLDGFRPDLEVVLVEHTRNRGRCGALNSGLQVARGTWVTFLDDDDVALPHHLETLTAAMAGRAGVGVYSHCLRVFEDETGRVTRTEVFADSDYDAQRLLVENFIVGMSALVPLEAVGRVGGLDPDLRVLEDWELWIRLSAEIPFEHVPVATAEYRWRPGSGNQSVREQFRFHTALEMIYSKHPVPGGSPVASARARMLAASSRRLEAYPYELSVVVECQDGEAEQAVETIQDFAEHLGSCGGVELVLAVPDLRDWEPLVAALSGDVQAFAVADVPPDDVPRFIRGRASGRRMALLRAGERLDLAAVGELLQRSSGEARVGRGALASAAR